MFGIKNKKESKGKKENILIYNGLKIKNGDFVTGTINGTIVNGRILVGNNEFKTNYFLQNYMDGSKPPSGNLMGFSYSWSFSKINDVSLTENVVILSKVNDKRKAGDRQSLVKRDPIKSGSMTVGYQIKLTESILVDIDGILVQLENPLSKKNISLFKEKAHPDCCGCTILYNFDTSDNPSYTRYRDLDDKDFEAIKGYLSSNPAKIVHLSHKQTESTKFVKKLGFKKVFEYVNANSRNTINVFHLNSSIEKPESEKEVAKEVAATE